MTERRLPDGAPVGPGLDAHGWPLPAGRENEWEEEQLARLLHATAGLAALVEIITNPEKARTFLTAQKALTEALDRARQQQQPDQDGMAVCPCCGVSIDTTVISLPYHLRYCRKGQATTTVEEHPVTSCADCGGPFQAGRLSGARVRGRWVHERTCPDREDPRPEEERCIHCSDPIGSSSYVFVDRVDVGWRGWAHTDCWMKVLPIIHPRSAPKEQGPPGPALVDVCDHCEQPFSPDSPGRVNQTGTAWRHMACPNCWLCRQPLGTGAGQEWVNLRGEAGMAHLTCWEAAKRDAKQDL